MTAPPDAAVELRGVGKRFGATVALDDLTLTIRKGEFFSLLGPSGCGKTTTLNLIGGFETASSGELLIEGRPVHGMPAHTRPVNTVFQNYALFPHLNVLQNVEFGLRMKKVPQQERRRAALEMLELVSLEGYEARRPAQLSGGQRQRVALARALVNRPSVLLLDEPLGALDLKLRKQMQAELTRLQRQVGITFVYVTHDQEEALAMSDRIAVMNRGRVEQIGSPREIYERPETPFVADFIGSLNALELTVDEIVGGYAVSRIGEDERIVVPVGSDTRAAETVRVAVRPEQVQIEPAESAGGEGGSRLDGKVAEIVYLGMYTQFHVDTRAGRVVSHRLADEVLSRVSVGSRVTLSWPPEHASLLGTAEPLALA